MSRLPEVVAAYKAMLLLPLGSPERAMADQALARCRDYIAEHTQCDAEVVQTSFEFVAHVEAIARIADRVRR